MRSTLVFRPRGANGFSVCLLSPSRAGHCLGARFKGARQHSFHQQIISEERRMKTRPRRRHGACLTLLTMLAVAAASAQGAGPSISPIADQTIEQGATTGPPTSRSTIRIRP